MKNNNIPLIVNADFSFVRCWQWKRTTHVLQRTHTQFTSVCVYYNNLLVRPLDKDLIYQFNGWNKEKSQRKKQQKRLCGAVKSCLTYNCFIDFVREAYSLCNGWFILEQVAKKNWLQFEILKIRKYWMILQNANVKKVEVPLGNKFSTNLRRPKPKLHPMNTIFITITEQLLVCDHLYCI